MVILMFGKRLLSLCVGALYGLTMLNTEKLNVADAVDGWNCAYWDESSLPYFDVPIYCDEFDWHALYTVVEHEVGIYSQRSKCIVACTVINRYLDGWANGIWDVVTMDGQYEGIMDVIWDYNYASADTIACVDWVLESGIDYSNGATSFYNRDICGYIDWFENQELVAELDGHRYFKLWE